MNKPAAVLAVPEQEFFFEGLLGYHMRRASVMVMGDLTDALAPLALRPADATVLMLISANPGFTQSDVGKVLGILRANMAPLLATLLKRGLVDREPVDGRSQALKLSSAGQEVCRQVKRIAREHENRVFAGISKSAKARMVAQLRGIWSENHRVER